MTHQPFEYAPKSAETSPVVFEKQEFLTAVFPPALRTEINNIYARGYAVSVGETEDTAYESIDKITEVFTDLQDKGVQFSEGSKRFALGSSALASALEYTPVPQFNAVRRRIKAQREALRHDLLYGLEDVQGMPWHDQNGKALALGTIVDAHELRAVGETSGTFDTVSGRLADSLTADFSFSSEAVSGNIAGKHLRDAVFDTKNTFSRGKSANRVQASVERDIARLDAFTSAPVHAGFKDIVAYCTDSLGIRSRKEEVRKEINRHVDASDKEAFLMMSVGCGTAQPMLEVMQDLYAKGRQSKLILIDQDPIALAAASELAAQMGLEDAIEIHCNQLFVGSGRSTRVMDIQDVLQGRELDVCEDSGLREYFPDAMYEDLTRQAWDALAEDGLMTTGNMNKNRPQPEFLHGLMGWPIQVRMRHIQDITRLHKKAGIPPSSSRLRVTQDGVYTLCFSSKKPLS